MQSLKVDSLPIGSCYHTITLDFVRFYTKQLCPDRSSNLYNYLAHIGFRVKSHRFSERMAPISPLRSYERTIFIRYMQPLVVIETHPVQYHAPVYRVLQQKYGIPVTAIYGSDFSIAGYQDSGFDTKLAWDTDLLSGYTSYFLSRVSDGGARSTRELNSRGLRKALRMADPAAVLLLGYYSKFYLDAFWQAWLSGSSLLLRAEATDHTKIRKPVEALLRDTFLHFIYKHFDAFLPIGKRSADHYYRLMGNKIPHFFSPYCVDVTAFRPTEEGRKQLRERTRHSLNITERMCVLMFVGKLMSVKSLDVLVDAVKQLPINQRENLVILFVGEGQLRPMLEQRTAEAPAINTRFVGFQNQTELSPFYHASDIFVLPSRSETWGLVINEALHHGLPCIVSSQVGCAPDLVIPGETGEVFESGNVTQLIHAITSALMLTNQASIRERCRTQVASYTVERAASGIAEAFKYVTTAKPVVRFSFPR